MCRNLSSYDLLFPTLHDPERKDRENGAYCGVIVYIKNTLSYIRQYDLEPATLECGWVHKKLCNNKSVLYGVFYRPLNSSSVCSSLIEDSISLAIDTNISDIVITGDFNWNQLNQNHFK